MKTSEESLIVRACRNYVTLQWLVHQKSGSIQMIRSVVADALGVPARELTTAMAEQEELDVLYTKFHGEIIRFNGVGR